MFFVYYLPIRIKNARSVRLRRVALKYLHELSRSDYRVSQSKARLGRLPRISPTLPELFTRIILGSSNSRFLPIFPLPEDLPFD